MSARELHEALTRAGDTVGLTTVYRALSELAESGRVDVLRTGEGEAIYRRCASDEHHHHLVCRSCGDAVEVRAEAIERWAREVAEEHGFTSITHTAEVFGVCTACERTGP